MTPKHVTVTLKLFEALKLIQTMKEPAFKQTNDKLSDLIIQATKLISDIPEGTPKK